MNKIIMFRKLLSEKPVNKKCCRIVVTSIQCIELSQSAVILLYRKIIIIIMKVPVITYLAICMWSSCNRGLFFKGKCIRNKMLGTVETVHVLPLFNSHSA